MSVFKMENLKNPTFPIYFHTHFHDELEYHGQVEQISEDILTVISDKAPALGHLVQFKIYENEDKTREVLRGTAKLTLIEQSPPKMSITLKIVQTDNLEVQNFRRSVSQRKDVTKFVRSLRVAVVSKTRAIRSSIQNALMDLGLSLFSHFESSTQAISELTVERTDCLVADWDCDESDSGIQLVRKLRGEGKSQPICILTTPIIDRNRIAQAMEFEIDEFLAQPFTVGSLQGTFWRGLKKRKFTTPYSTLVKKAEDFIAQKKFDEARKILEKAVTLESAPVTAHYLQGYMCMINNKTEDALAHFDLGLKQKANHLKCLFGRAFVLRHLGQMDAYYNTLKHILDIYPQHPASLGDALPLALQKEDVATTQRIVAGMAKSLKKNQNFQAALETFAVPSLELAASKGNAESCQFLLNELAQASQSNIKLLNLLKQTAKQHAWTFPKLENEK